MHSTMLRAEHQFLSWKYMELASATKTQYGKYDLTNAAGTLRNCGGDVGGGSETLVICSIKEQSAHCNTMTTKGQTDNMSKRIN